MPDTISRASLLRGRWRPQAGGIRPPWAAVDGGFEAACDGCGDCASACPEQIIVARRGAWPEVDFQRGACTFCGACVEACPTGVLADQGQAPWSSVARIGASCFSAQGITCRLCEEHCEPRAIRFRPLPGGRALPEVAAEACTGCGACAHVCPTDAVDFQELPT